MKCFEVQGRCICGNNGWSMLCVHDKQVTDYDINVSGTEDVGATSHVALTEEVVEGTTGAGVVVHQEMTGDQVVTHGDLHPEMDPKTTAGI